MGYERSDGSELFERTAVTKTREKERQSKRRSKALTLRTNITPSFLLETHLPRSLRPNHLSRNPQPRVPHANKRRQDRLRLLRNRELWLRFARFSQAFVSCCNVGK